LLPHPDAVRQQSISDGRDGALEESGQLLQAATVFLVEDAHHVVVVVVHVDLSFAVEYLRDRKERFSTIAEVFFAMERFFLSGRFPDGWWNTSAKKTRKIVGGNRIQVNYVNMNNMNT
jgi:hypothetical protein